jgi:hypothetical protein
LNLQALKVNKIESYDMSEIRSNLYEQPPIETIAPSAPPGANGKIVGAGVDGASVDRVKPRASSSVTITGGTFHNVFVGEGDITINNFGSSAQPFFTSSAGGKQTGGKITGMHFGKGKVNGVEVPKK